MEWESLLTKLKSEVETGEVTTYKELSLWAFEKPFGTQAVVAMLKAAVNADSSNAIYTNRVVPESGKIADVNGQGNQLKNEGIVLNAGKIDFYKTKVVRFN